MINQPQRETAEFIMLVGIPASGKSTLVDHYRKAEYQVISSDLIREEQTAGISMDGMSDQERRKINVQVFDAVRRQTQELLKKGQSVVLDATNLSRKNRMNFLKQLQRLDCKRKCILLITPVEICLERNSRRIGNARVPENAMYRMLCNFECPNYWEGWDEIIPVAADIPYRFPFAACEGFSQDNPHHTLSLGAHMAQTEQDCADIGRGDLCRAARYHDIGKLYTKRFENKRGEKTEIAHYYDHENYGAYLFLTEMCCGNNVSGSVFNRILYDANLINCHMRPMTRWTYIDNAEEKDRLLFGDAFVNDLILLHQADRAAH